MLEIAEEAAAKRGQSVAVWASLHGISTTTLYAKHGKRPSLGTIYRVCDAAGIKTIEFFRRLGR